MGRDSRIEWTDHTFNPWWGCTKVSSACDNCYAEVWARRLGFDIWSHGKPRRFLSENYWQQPKKWNQAALESNRRARVFCASMADVFEWGKALSTWRAKLWQVIEETPNLDWLLLTKRPHLVRRLAPWGDHWPRNVWLGTTAEDQRTLEKRLPHLLVNPSRIRFLSCEPLLEAMDLRPKLASDSVQWVIAGGESGANARPCDPQWVRDIRDSCLEFNVPFHFKQWGDWAPLSEVSGAVPRSVLSNGVYSTQIGRFGKKASGRLLENQVWDGLPSVQ